MNRELIGSRSNERGRANDMARLTMEDIRAGNRAIGHHWFDRDTMRGFGCRLGAETVYQGVGGIYFVSSERRGAWGRVPAGERLYTVRRYWPDGAIGTVGEFQAWKTGSGAANEARRLAHGLAAYIRPRSELIEKKRIDVKSVAAHIKRHGSAREKAATIHHLYSPDPDDDDTRIGVMGEGDVYLCTIVISVQGVMTIC